MSIDKEKKIEKKENKLEPPIKKQELVKTLKKLLEEEIYISIDNLKNQDEKVEEIERDVDLNNDVLVEETREEIHLKESLQKINSEAEKLKKDTFAELDMEKSFWGQIESVEEKVKKVQDLFNNLNTEELLREDIETHARGWNVTNNIEQLKNLRESIIGRISGKTNWSLSGMQNFKELISQKQYQDIVWISSGIDPDVLTTFNANFRFNAFIQERPLFLESVEFKKVRLHQIKEGIKNGTLFEGYTHNVVEKFPETKIDFFKEENQSDSFAFKEEGNIFDKDKNKKRKRKSIGNENSPLIINIEKYEYDISNIDSLTVQEKNEVKDFFINKISRNMYGRYSCEKVFAEEIFKVGSKLGVDESEINQHVYNAMLQGIVSNRPPASGIDKEFSEVYKKIQETLSTLETREELLKVIFNNIRSTDEYFDSWKYSFDYINLSEEELAKARTAYLDFSSGDILEDKLKDVFGYSWHTEEDLHFSKEERLKAFETMNSDQKSYIIASYSGYMEKIKFLSFTKEDILEFAVNSIKSSYNVFPSDIEQAQKNILENFPDASINNTDIAKRVTFKRLESIREIKESLVRNSVEMSLKEIVSQFNSPSDFVLKQIKGAELYKLKALEELKKDPDAPELPDLSNELFNEIKQHILKRKDDYYDDKSQLKELISFVPKRYTLELLSDPDIQETFSNYYANALRKNDQKFIHDLGFLISKSETLHNAEQKVLDGYLQEKDYCSLIKYHEILFKNDTSSPILKKIEEFFKERINVYGLDSEDVSLDHSTLGKTLKDISSQKLNQLNHNNLQDDELTGEWLNISFGADSKKILQVYNLIKNTKDFSYFDKKIKNLLTHISVSEKLIGTLQKLSEDKTEGIDRAVEFVNDLVKIFDDNFIEQNYDHLYQIFSKLNPEEYIQKIQLLGELKPFLSSSIVLKINLDNSFDVEFVKDIGKIFDHSFFEQNYDYLYKILSKLNLEEYREKVKLLEKVRASLYSPLISKINFEKIFTEVSLYNQKDREIFFDLNDTPTYRLDSKKDLGWAKNIILYVNEVEEYGILHRDQNKKDKMVDLFSGEYKNTALHEMSAEYKDFLKSDANFLSPQIRIVSKIIDEAGGAGNMKHIESLGNFISQIQSTLDNKKTTDDTLQKTKRMLSVLEDRFSKEKWSQDDISEFYNLSRDILEAAPSLYVTFGPIFENIQSSKDMKKFMSDIFPFYQTQLVIKQNISGDTTTYNSRDLVEMRSSVKKFANKLTQNQVEKSNAFEVEKLRLLEIAKDGFKNRFGLLKVPDNFTKENLRSIQNTIRYMGNISGRTSEHESLISLYLGLELNNKWGDFRGGKEINFSEYLSTKQLQIVAPLLEEKQKSYELVSEVSGVTIEKMSKFQDLLQEDVSNNLIGSVQTIDVKLGNIKRNIDELVDPDIYQTQKEKDILGIISKEGKNVNAVLAKLYGVSTGKNIQLSEEDSKIKSKIESIFTVREWTPDKVKEIQDEIQPIGLVISMVNKMQEEKVEENITELQSRLMPNGQVIDIFNKLGEEFHQESGALALSRDLSYLENLIIKDENKITAEEKEVVKNYIESIREKMKDMENVFDHVKQYFEKIKKSSHMDNNPVLKSRITEIEKVIYSQDTNSIITSHMTKDLNLIIENMRQCLGCMRKEANNDTNLAFGDYNKFFMMNQAEKEKGSISDEIVFFVPITMPDGSKEMSFVMDKVYGSKSSDVLVGNISAVYKKYQVIKKEFPDSRMSISITNSAMSTVGIDSGILERRLKDILNKKITIETFKELSAFIPKSSLSDNYVEFGKDASARQTGERNFSGLVLR